MYNDVVKFIEACEQERCFENISLYRNLIIEVFW